MPHDCRYMRTRLQIEYSRLSDWTEAAGLIEYDGGQHLPDILKTDRLVLVAILTEIRSSMEDLADINGRYIDLQPDEDPVKKKQAMKLELIEEYSDIALSYEKRAAERKYLRGLNHIVRGTAMAKDIIKHPKQLEWVAFDRDVFKQILVRLTELNDHLHEMMHGHQARALEAATERTYLEMVQVRTSVDELKHLVTAAMLLQERDTGESSRSVLRRRNEKSLAALAGFKSLNAANEAHSSHKPPAYESAMKRTRLTFSSMSSLCDTTNSCGLFSSVRTRTEGKYYPSNGTERHVWVEWKTYKTEYDSRLDKHVPTKKTVRRVEELVALLQSEKPEQFCAPRCLGYFDDRDDTAESQHDYRFGLVFEKPNPDSMPKSLHQMLPERKPSLTNRVFLAHKIATCVLYLHAVDWLHKALRSDSILFFPDNNNNANLGQPKLTGFEFARPDKHGETTTTGEANEWCELYVHPNYQGSNAKGTYRKTFDIYSLGIILLEISYWKPIEQIVGIDPDCAQLAELKSIRSRLLDPEAGHLAQVLADQGEKYHEAVKCCLEGRPAFGIGEEEDEADVLTGAKLQHAFMTHVVDALESICT